MSAQNGVTQILFNRNNYTITSDFIIENPLKIVDRTRERLFLEDYINGMNQQLLLLLTESFTIGRHQEKTKS